MISMGISLKFFFSLFDFKDTQSLVNKVINSAPHTHTHTHTNTYLRKYAATPPSLVSLGIFSVVPFRQNHVPWGRLSLWKWVPEIYPGVKAADAYGWRSTTVVVPNVEMDRGLNLLGTLRATSVCCGTPLLYIYIYIYIHIYSTNIPPVMIINRIYETQNRLLL